MEIAGLVLIGIGTAYGAIYGGIKLYWAWQDRREAEPESKKLISDPAALDKAWRASREEISRLPAPRSAFPRVVSGRTIIAIVFVTGLILLLLSRL